MKKDKSQQSWRTVLAWIRRVSFRTGSPLYKNTSGRGFLRRNQVLLCVAAVLLGVMAFGGRHVYRAAVSWRARSLATKALDQLEKQDLPGAFSTIRAACQLRPADPVVMRATASVLEKVGDPLSIHFRKQLVELPGATMEDRRLYARDSIERRLVDPKVEEQIRFLLQKEPGNAGNWLLAARFYENSGLTDRTLAYARHALELDTHFDEANFFLATQLIKSPDSSSEGIDLLWTLFRAGGKSSLPAAMILSQKKTLSQDEANSLLAHVKSDPQAKEIHKLQALDLGIRIHPEQRAQLIEAAIQSLPARDDEALREMAVWLNSHDEPGRTVALIPADSRAKSRTLLLVYLDAMAAMKKWQEIDTLVSTKGVPLEPAVIELFRGRCAMELGRPEDGSLHWRAALSATAGNPEQTFYVAHYIRQSGRIEQARDIYRNLIQNPTTARAAYLELLHLESEHGNTAAVYGVLRDMHERWAKDEDILNDYAYFSLLLKLNVDQSLEIARGLEKASPEKMAHRTTLALALLRTHDPSSALEVYNGLEINWNSEPASYKVIYAAVLKANGRTAEAARTMATLRPDDLRPEEKALIQ